MQTHIFFLLHVFFSAKSGVAVKADPRFDTAAICDIIRAICVCVVIGRGLQARLTTPSPLSFGEKCGAGWPWMLSIQGQTVELFSLRSDSSGLCLGGRRGCPPPENVYACAVCMRFSAAYGRNLPKAG